MDPVLFIGRSQSEPGRKLAAALGIEPARCAIEDFADGELHVEVQQDVLDRDIFVLQATGAPAERNLIELLLLADVCRRRGARCVTAVLPYFGYARQDRRDTDTEAIAARLMTDLLATRCDRIIAVDLHNEAVEGFANVPFHHLSAVPLLAEAFHRYRTDDQVLVAPDAGATRLAQRYGQLLELPVAYIEKVRRSDQDVEVQAVAGDVENARPVLVDDMISTGGTVSAAIEALIEAGAKREVSILVSHCLLAGEAPQRLSRYPVQRILTTDSLTSTNPTGLSIERCSLAPLIADALHELTRS